MQRAGCRSCGAALASGQNYCLRCGAPVDEERAGWRRPALIALAVIAACAIAFALFLARVGSEAEDAAREAGQPAASAGQRLASLSTWSSAGAGSTGSGSYGSFSARMVATVDSASASTA